MEGLDPLCGASELHQVRDSSLDVDEAAAFLMDGTRPEGGGADASESAAGSDGQRAVRLGGWVAWSAGWHEWIKVYDLLSELMAPSRLESALLAAEAAEAAAARGCRELRPAEKEARAERRAQMLTGVVHEATLRRGRLQVKLGLWPLALVDIEAAAQSSAPATRRDAQWEMAQLLEAMDRPEEALAQTERLLPPPHGSATDAEALEGDVLADAMELAAALHARLGRPARALALYDALLEMAPERTSALLAAGELREAHEQTDRTLRDDGVDSALLSVSYLRRASLHQPADDALLGRIVSLLHAYDDKPEGDGTAALAAAIAHMGDMLALPEATAKGPTPAWVAVVLVRRAKLLAEHASLCLERPVEGPGSRYASEADQLYKAAVDDLTRAIKLRPPPPRLLLGEALLCRGQLEGRVARKRALADLAMARALLPADPRPSMARGLLLEGQGEHCAALGEYQEASTRTRRGFPLVAIALVHRNWHDEPHVAIYYLTRAIQQDPHYLRARALRADCLLQLGDVKGALRDVGRARHLAPAHPLLLALHAECVLRLGRVPEVAADCFSLARLDAAAAQEPARQELMAECALLLGRPHDAVALLKAALGEAAGQRAIGQTQSVTLRLSLLALAHHCCGQLDRAAALLCAPGAIGVLAGEEACLFCLRRGHVLLAQRRYDEAMAAYREALKHFPDDALAREAVAWAAHLAPGERHSPKAERKAYDELLKRDPGFLRARLHRAQLLWRMSEDRAAAAELGSVLEVFAPASAGVETARARFIALLFRALILLDTHQFGAALADLWEAAQLRVSRKLERLVRFATGSCMLQVGDAVEARRDLSRLVEGIEAEAAAAAAAEEGGGPAGMPREAEGPLCLGAYFNLGLVEQRLGKPRSALRCFEAAQRQANALDIASPAAHEAEGEGKGGPSQLSQAGARQLRMATEARVSTHLAAAQTLQALDRLSEASAQYDAALRVQPRSQLALLCRGDFFFSAAKVADARRSYSRALHERPHAVAPRVAMARLLHHEGHLAAASRMVSSALAFERRDPHALETRAVLRMSEADHEGALHDLHAALTCAAAPPRRSAPWAEWLCNRAAVSVLRADVRAAAADLRTAAVEARFGCPRALEGLGALAMRGAQYAKAAALYDETLAALDRQAPIEHASPPPTPSQAEEEPGEGLDGLDGLASPPSSTSASATADPSAAGAQPQKRAQHRRGSTASATTAAATVATAAAATEATGARGPAFRARAARGRALLGAGVAYAMEGQLDTALERLDGAVALRAHCGRTCFNRGVLHLLLEQWEDAERDLLSCVTKLPLEPEAWRHKHTALVRQGAVGRTREALVDYANALLLTDFFTEGYE